MQHSVILKQTLLTIHFIGLALGLGGAAMADFSFFKAVKMGDRITPETVAWMRSISRLVWIGIAILTVSGFGLFLMQPSVYLSSAGFLAKMLFVAILIINGMFLNFYTTARLTTFNFSKIYTRRDAAWKARKLSFIFGAISTVSWYAALLAAQFKDVVKFSFTDYVLLYLLALGFAIVVALLVEYWLHSKHHAAPLTIDKLTSSSPTPTIPVQPAPLDPTAPTPSTPPPTIAQPANYQQATPTNVTPTNINPT